jgi:hypothetical protein
LFWSHMRPPLICMFGWKWWARWRRH